YNTQLNNTNIELNKFLIIDDNNILAYGRNNSSYTIYKYSFRDEGMKNSLIQKGHKNEFVIYSLYENETIENYVLNFKESYSNISFEYRYGISENNDINENDAILALNIELLNGKGPDILFLDYLNTDSYIEKEILENLNDIVDKNKENLFDNIIMEYEKDGNIYSIPTAFSIPIIIGQDVSDIKDLNSLILKCEENINDEEIILNISSAEEVVDTFYDSISTNILRADKSLNVEAIKDSLNKLKKIYDLTVTNLSDYEEEIIKDNRQYIDNFLALYLVHKNADINISNINSYNDILFLSGVKNQYNCEYSVWNNNNESYFKAKNIISVNSNSKNKDIAKEFVNSILNGGFYNTELSNLSVNKDVLKNNLYEIKDYDSGVVIMDENGEGDSLESIKLTENDIENITNYISSLNKVINSNSIILERVKNEFISYIKGDINIEEAINKINDNLEIYLSE
ncbi:extracellular solute-binding protein, partial [Clostridium sp. D53t1_180928_C8]|uniref:extracellular solute-binding protein n=1 Tax=Clostridium sp. D53t1_180928_C8 TaxID=2787101 RepID=UPI0018A98518